MSHMAAAAAAAAASDSRVSKSTIDSAVNALLKYKAAQSSTQKLQLLPGDDYIYLNLTLKKIPSNPRTNPYRISLPHPILDASSQLCLIIDDRPKSTTPPSDEIKKLIKSQNIPISKVIKISKLKTNYKPFEAKRKLCDSYDLFLVDKRVVHLLPKLIGKQFFKKKKLPLGVDLGKKNLKSKVESALGSALMYVRSGTCCVMKVAKVEMEKNEVVENVFDAIKGAVERVPKKWDGVRSLHLKFSDSVALPIYQAMPDVKLKIEGLKDTEEEAQLMKISDNDGDVKETSGVKNGKSGKKKKGRIHEVNYMDIKEDIGSDDDDIDEIAQVRDENDDEFVGMKGMDESDDDDDETKKTDKELDVDETVGKKRSRDKASKLVKKKAKAEKNVGKKSEEDGSEEVADEQGKKKAKAEKNVGKKLKKNGPEEVAGMQGKKKTEVADEQGKKKAKAEKNVGKKPKKNGPEEVADMEGNKKTELGRKPSERIAKLKDAKPKKRVSAK